MADPRHGRGDLVKLYCPHKAEHGIRGRVVSVRPYTGPRLLDEWEYVVERVDSSWPWSTRTCTWPERWVVPMTWKERQDPERNPQGFSRTSKTGTRDGSQVPGK